MKIGKMLYRGTIAVDIDGVLADFESKFCEDFGANNRYIYELEKRYPEIDRELIREYVENPENYIDLAPIFGGLLFTRQAHARGWYILLVTSRSTKLREVTKSWLEKYGVVYNELIFSKNKKEAIADYDAIYPSRKVAIVVDDSVKVLKSMPDKYCIAWNQLWNFGYFPYMYYTTERMKLELDLGEGKYPRIVGIWDKAK